MDRAIHGGGEREGGKEALDHSFNLCCALVCRKGEIHEEEEGKGNGEGKGR